MKVGRYIEEDNYGYGDGVLVLEADDFKIDNHDVARKHAQNARGHRFSFCLIPKEFEKTYDNHPIYWAIAGTIMIGAMVKAKLIFY